ncbi:unnamed protein product [Dovyalis caffra]|uniref:Uncharacterized protein n=1 Tax=Dovyalis caffra TaxID=77055 RepID=A0AAV1S8C6_9ROSI|nr:unnamed protein product [Dovyalis caffra]
MASPIKERSVTQFTSRDDLQVTPPSSLPHPNLSHPWVESASAASITQTKAESNKELSNE